jgi:hypothetical protein
LKPQKPNQKEQTMKISHSFIRLFLITFALGSFALCQVLEAVMPAPDGGYPGGNTAEGTSALLNVTSGHYNTAVGWLSLESTITGSWNTAVGAATLLANTGDDNTAIGAGALFRNTTGTDNTATGLGALFDNTQGYQNTADGVNALGNNFAYQNTAVGVNALLGNTYGTSNTAVGVDALLANLDGSYNTAVGYRALHSLNGNFTGFNTAVGDFALYNDTSGGGNVGLGNNAGLSVTTANNVICIGSGIQGENVSDSCYIGNIFGQNSFESTGVFVNSAGKLGTNPSSRRFKEDIKPMHKASEAVLALKPVTFHYKADSKATAQFGLIAEEVAKVNPDLVVRDKEGKPYTVRYDQVNAMLLNEFLKEHKKLEEQQVTIAQLRSAVAQQQNRFESKLAEQQNQIATLTAGLQNVSARLETSKAKPRVVANNP